MAFAPDADIRKQAQYLTTRFQIPLISLPQTTTGGSFALQDRKALQRAVNLSDATPSRQCLWVTALRMAVVGLIRRSGVPLDDQHEVTARIVPRRVAHQ